ncbi:alpha/beta hydrolase [Terrabacter carboxydivorans]|uniref:alpha/beta hydrolase n=1 Tax=Terrabacter carboxydivorans TaxID=619730 RepID=UPI0031E0F7CD
MTLSVRDIRSSRPQTLAAVGRGLEDRRRRVLVLAELVLWRRSAAPRWLGAASSAAADRYGLVVAGLGGLASSIAVAGQALGRAAAQLQAALDLIGRADRRAAEEGAWVDGEGRLFLPVRAVLGEPLLEAHRACLDELLRAEVHACLDQARRAAGLADEELLRQLLSSARGATAAGGGSASIPATLPPPPPAASVGVGGQAFASAAWWRSLTDEERRTVVRDRPEWVGPRDGVPAAARHAANLVLLGRAEQAARVRYLEARDGGWVGSEPRRRLASQEVAALQAIRDVLSRRDGGERRLLLVDTTGLHPKAVVAIGDVDTAEHVVTFVGGLSTMVDTDLRRYDDTFVRLRAETRAAARGQDVAIVTWMGYEAPQVREIVTSVDRNVLNAKLARDNAASLADFATGLEAARDRPAHQTVWAHSYGGLLAGFASLRTSAVDDVAVFGAPGLPFSDASATALKPGSLNVLGALGDDVFDYGSIVHGTAPGEVVGATRLSTFALKEPGTGCNHWLRARADFVDVGRTSVGHSDYLRAGTESARNLIAVAAGRPDLRVLQGADERACTTVGPGLGFDVLHLPRLVP